MFFSSFFLMKVELIYNVVLVSSVHQSYTCAHTHTHTLTHTHARTHTRAHTHMHTHTHTLTCAHTHSHAHTHTHAHTYTHTLLFRVFSIAGYYEVLSKVLCALRQVLLFPCLIDSSVYMLILNSQFISQRFCLNFFLI